MIHATHMSIASDRPNRYESLTWNVIGTLFVNLIHEFYTTLTLSLSTFPVMGYRGRRTYPPPLAACFEHRAIKHSHLSRLEYSLQASPTISDSFCLIFVFIGSFNFIVPNPLQAWSDMQREQWIEFLPVVWSFMFSLTWCSWLTRLLLLLSLSLIF